MDISNISKAKILAALYNESRAGGLGAFQQSNAKPMTEEEAQKILDEGETSFDYIRGKIMKIDLSSNELDTYLYNRDIGEGAAERIIESLK